MGNLKVTMDENGVYEYKSKDCYTKGKFWEWQNNHCKKICKDVMEEELYLFHKT